MILINYPAFQYKIRETAPKKEEIWDEVRRQWVSLTSEEWVRQNFIQFLVQSCGYPGAYMAVERKIQLGELRKRFDILVYNRAAKPWMMIECKAREVELSKKVLSQVLTYNMAVPVPYLLITNGLHCHGYYRDGIGAAQISVMPAYE